MPLTATCPVVVDGVHSFCLNLEHDQSGNTITCEHCGMRYDPVVHGPFNQAPALKSQTLAERAWHCFLHLKIHGLLTDADGVKVRRRFANKFPGVAIGPDGKELKDAEG